jgi:hypothetical protein
MLTGGSTTNTIRDGQPESTVGRCCAPSITGDIRSRCQCQPMGFRCLRVLPRTWSRPGNSPHSCVDTLTAPTHVLL